MITLVAPALRTAFTSSCIPAAWKVIPRQLPPSHQQRHAAGVSALLTGIGSLSGSLTTFARQVRIAGTEADSDGPSEMPPSCAQAYSAQKRFTPLSLSVPPPVSMSLFPSTCTACAGARPGGTWTPAELP